MGFFALTATCHSDAKRKNLGGQAQNDKEEEIRSMHTRTGRVRGVRFASQMQNDKDEILRVVATLLTQNDKVLLECRHLFCHVERSEAESKHLWFLKDFMMTKWLRLLANSPNFKCKV